MSNKYVSPSALQHYDEKIKEYIDEQLITDGNDYDDSALVERIENVETTLNGKADASDIPDVSNFVEKETGKGLFSGSYNDLTDKPTIPSVDGLVSEETLNTTLEDYVKSEDLPNDYDDTALSNRVKTIEDDYLTNADKTALTSAIATAKSEAIITVLGEAVDADFDTLKEVADWIQSDTTASAELVTRVTNVEADINTLETSVSNKVDKVSGKGLSTNDLTSTLKSNYDTAYTHSQSTHAPSTAEKNVIVGIQKNGTDLTVDSSTRKVNITVPTKTSELINDSSFKTTDNNTTYSLSKSGSTITLTGSDGSTTSVTDSNTIYTHPTYTTKANGLYKVSVDATGHISTATAVTKDDITALGIPASDTNTVTTVTTTGSGNAITALSATNGAITATKGSTFLTAHPTISKSTDTTSTATATHGGTITMVDSVTRDSNGHVTKVNTKTVTLPTDNNTVYTHPTSSGNKHIPSGGSSGQILRWSADGTAVWGSDNNTTYGVVSTTADGLAPKRDGSTTKFLRADGTWATPPDTKYTLPTASSSTLGGVKTTSTVTSTSGLTACPIISGVPYYKDTITTVGSGTTLGTITVASGQGAPTTTISTNCNLSGGMLKTSPGGTTEIAYGVAITDPSSDGSRATINGYKILHTGNIGSLTKSLSDSVTYTNSSGGTETGEFTLAGTTSYRANNYGSDGKAYSLKLQVWRRPHVNNAPYTHSQGDFILFIKNLLPSLNNSSELGSSSYRWKNVYCSTGAFNGSDRKIKKDINYNLDDRYTTLFDNLKICSYKYKAGTSDRTHIGVVAQDMLETMNEIGMDTKEFAGIGLDSLSDSETQTKRYYYDLYCGFNNTFYNEIDGSVNTDRHQRRETLTYDVHYRDSISIFDREQRFLILKTNAEPTNYEEIEETFPDITIHSIKLTSKDESVEDYEINLHNHIAYDPEFHSVEFEYTDDGSLRIIPKERYDGVGIALREDQELIDLSMYDNIVIDVTYSDEFILGANYHEYDIYHEMSEEERTIYMVRWGEIAALNVMKTQEHTHKIQSLEEELRQLKEELRLLKEQKY